MLQDGLPLGETPATLRKHALIACGYHSKMVLAMESGAASAAARAELMETFKRAHGYCVGDLAVGLQSLGATMSSLT